MLIYNILAILKIAYVQILLFRIGGGMLFFSLVILVCLFVSICSTIDILLKRFCINKVGIPQIIRRIFTMYIICSTYNGVFVNFLIFCFPKLDRKSTRLNSSHVKISYAVFCLKKKI